jgi:hypothetical protein
MDRSTTGAQLDQHLRGALAGQGDAIVRAAQKYGVDPRLLAAIAMHETGNGSSRGVRRNNNPGGLMDRRTNFRTQQRFSSMEQSFDAMARNLRRNYLDRGLRSISQIGRKYAPPRANNDPNNLNRHWVPNVTNLYQKLGTPAADGPSGTTSRDSGSTPGNLRATIDRVQNRGARNQMIEGTITVNGNTYRYRSGGHGRGSLPTGDYTVAPHMWSRNTPGMTVGGVGYSFALDDKYDPRVRGTRTALRIHPDGGSAGTQGCIGIVGNAEVQRRFREDMRAELMRNGGRVRLRVG